LDKRHISFSLVEYPQHKQRCMKYLVSSNLLKIHHSLHEATSYIYSLLFILKFVDIFYCNNH